MHSQPPSRTRRFLWAAVLAVAVVGSASGCAIDSVKHGFLPFYSDGEVTNHTHKITALWDGAWIAALIVGIITWGLILWCVAAYRKRKDDDVLPVQTRYHLPLEIMYTAVPIMMVLVLFYFTDKDMSAITDQSGKPDVTIQAIGKQWSWDFNYVDDNVYESGVQINDVGGIPESTMIDGQRGTSTEYPTLYLPVNETVKFKLDSRDVIHSFWIPAFLFKQDMIPGRENSFEVTPTRVGVYAGKCAELCGEHHSGMLFNVAVVPRDEYDRQMQKLRDAGQTGQLPVQGLSRVGANRVTDPNVKGDD